MSGAGGPGSGAPTPPPGPQPVPPPAAPAFTISDRRVALYLRDLDAVLQEAEDLAARGRAHFDSGAEPRRAAERMLDHASHIVGQLRERSALGTARPELPWRAIAGMHVKITKTYWQTDPGMVWRTLTRSLPELRQALTEEIAMAHAYQEEHPATPEQDRSYLDTRRADEWHPRTRDSGGAPRHGGPPQ